MDSTALTALTARVDELEQVKADRLAAWLKAEFAVEAGTPAAADLTSWRLHLERVTEAVSALEAYELASAHLKAAAELEQALKEDRWGDVSHWARKLEGFEPIVKAGPRYVVQYIGDEVVFPTYWVRDANMATVKLPAATRWADPIEAATGAPADWFDDNGAALFVVVEVND